MTEEDFNIPEGDFGPDNDSFLDSQIWTSQGRRSVDAAPIGGVQFDSLLDPQDIKCDFLTLITAISKVYSTNKYFPMISLHEAPWTTMAAGKDFEISRYFPDFETTYSWHRSQRKTTSPVIVKRLKNAPKKRPLAAQDIDLFVRELCVLHHMRVHENIVTLRGVGWLLKYVEDDMLTPCPEPIMLLEEAAETLKSLLQRSPSLTFQLETRLCKDVASGLLALHECGIIHGDVKPDNVLVFPFSTFEEGAETTQYTCKISDFSLARLEGYRGCIFNWGTPAYMAPERGQFLTSQELMLTDVWSLGILFAEVTDLTLDLVTREEYAERLGQRIHCRVRESIESSTWTRPMAELRKTMFDNTLQQEPTKRNLPRVVSNLEDFFMPVATVASALSHRYVSGIPDQNIQLTPFTIVILYTGSRSLT